MKHHGSIKIIRSRTSDGETEIGYTYADKRTVHVELDSPEALKAAKLQLVAKELEYCTSLVMNLLAMCGRRQLESEPRNYDEQHPDDLNLRAFHTALVITYGKVFSSAGKGRTRLDAQKIFKGDGAKFLPFHEWVMEARRHQHVAHADNSEFDNSRTVLVLPVPYSTEKFQAVVHHATFASDPSYREVMDFERLVLYVAQWVKAQVLDINAHILATLERTSFSDFYEAARSTTKLPLPGCPPPIPWD